MSTILEINNWYQLVSAKSEYNQDLKIVVEKYNSEKIIGTKIQIVSHNTSDVYLTLFVDLDSYELLPQEVLLPQDTIIEIINSFGFNVRISQPEVLGANVISILQGLYDGGYRYVYRDYIKHTDPIIYHNTVIYASKDIKLRKTGFNITKMPEFIIGDWNWCKPFKTYPIEDLLNGTVDNGTE